MVTTPIQAAAPDLRGWVSGDLFMNADLHFLRMRDAHAKFVIDTLTDDAFARGFVFKQEGSDEDRIILKHCRRAAKWSRQFGCGFVYVSDGEIESFPPFTVGDEGGVMRVETDPMTGYPMEYQVRIGRQKTVTLPADKVVIFTNGDATRSWQGYSELGATIDEYILKRSWRGAALQRARAYSAAVHLLTTKNDMVSEVDKEEIKKSFPHGDVAVVSGEWDYTKIGGSLEAGELDRVMDDSMAALAVGAGITVNDMKGGEAGQKLSTDSNQHHYFAEVRAIQDTFYIPCREVYARFGITVVRFEDPWVMQRTEKLRLMLEISQLLLAENLDPKVRAILLHQLETLQ